jgi:hypothetical protein
MEAATYNSMLSIVRWENTIVIKWDTTIES